MSAQPERGAVASSRWVDQQLEAFRCRTCQKKLMMMSATRESPLRSGMVIEIRCSACKTMNYLMGSQT